jgi:drug/metabolite transporter (DMT)-like permease
VIPFGALALGVLCALAWGGLDALRKQLSGAVAPAPLLVLLHLALLPVFAAWWAIAGGTITDLRAYALPGGISMVLQIVANGLFLAAVRASPLSLTIPFLALTPVFATFASALTLGEWPSMVQAIGIALVVLSALGLGSVGSDRDEDSERVRLLRVFADEPGAPMMVGVALCWGGSTTLDKQALLYASVPVHALLQISSVILAAFIYLIARGRLRELALERRQWPRLALAAAAGSLALGLQLVAVQILLVSVLETIKRALGMISALVLGQLIFGEALTAAKLISVAVMIVGVVLVML